jgi:transcriptional regulator with XRE-family HTH domain
MERSGRAAGIAVDTDRVRRARIEAGLSLADVAGSDVSRTMIHFVETGKSRPSKRVLRLIARRVGKPITYFMQEGKEESPKGEDVAAELSAAAARLKRFANASELIEVERQVLQLAEVTLRQTASLARSIQRPQPARSRALKQRRKPPI